MAVETQGYSSNMIIQGKSLCLKKFGLQEIIATPTTTQDYIHWVRTRCHLGKTQLTKPGILAEGEPLPCTKGLV